MAAASAVRGVNAAVLMNRYLREMNRDAGEGKRRYRDLHINCKDGVLMWNCIFLAPVIADDLWHSLASIGDSCQKCKGATTLVLPDFDRETATHFLELLTQGVANMASASQVTKLGELLQALGVDLNKCSTQQQQQQQQPPAQQQPQPQEHQQRLEALPSTSVRDGGKEKIGTSKKTSSTAENPDPDSLEMTVEVMETSILEPAGIGVGGGGQEDEASELVLQQHEEDEDAPEIYELSSTSSEGSPTPPPSPAPAPVPAFAPPRPPSDASDKSCSRRRGSKIHRCPRCDKEYPKRGLLLGHLSRKHYLKELLDKYEKGAAKDQEGGIICGICSAIIKRKPNFASHMGFIHRKVLEFVPASMGVKRGKKKRAKVGRRMASPAPSTCSSVTAVHKCPTCGEGSFTPKGLARHLCAAHHYQEVKDLVKTKFPDALESLTCHHCDFKIKSQQNLYLHYGSSHGYVLDLMGPGLARRTMEDLGIEKKEGRLE